LLALLIVALVAVHASNEEDQFQDFIAKYHKSYSPSEYQTRFNIFKRNLEIAADYQARTTKTIFGVTKFMDLTPEEFADQYFIKNYSRHHNFDKAIKYVAPKDGPKSYPASYDWSSRGVITPVYNQGQCGSCWAFSTTENIESMWALAGNALVTLSMQQIVDCDTSDGGCNGGNPPTAYEYVMGAGGLELYNDYPYVGYQQQCQFNSGDIAATISSWQWITQDDDEANMQSFVYSTGPPSICVDAQLWQYWQGGVVTSDSGCGTSLDHCVQLTGWSQMSGMNVWNVRNSWGADWGPYGGYIYLEMGYDVCGIGQVVTSSII
jgi:cathepsin F